MLPPPHDASAADICRMEEGAKRDVGTVIFFALKGTAIILRRL